MAQTGEAEAAVPGATGTLPCSSPTAGQSWCCCSSRCGSLGKLEWDLLPQQTIVHIRDGTTAPCFCRISFPPKTKEFYRMQDLKLHSNFASDWILALEPSQSPPPGDSSAPLARPTPLCKGLQLLWHSSSWTRSSQK